MNHLERPADSAGAISPELAAQQRARRRALRRVSKLREKASQEIERLISFLDACDPYVMHELEEDDEREDGGDDEPLLGSHEIRPGGAVSYLFHPIHAGSETYVDGERDTADLEPSLGSLEWDNQTRWGHSARADLEEQCDDEGSAA